MHHQNPSENLRKYSYTNTFESLGKHQCPEWFKDAKLGMFIDWGPWSVAGYKPDWCEWSIYEDKGYYHEIWGTDIRSDDFINLLSDRKFDPAEFAKLAKECGFRYVVPFLRHHGGYSLWDSSFTRRDSMDWNFHRDFALEFSKACKTEGLKFGAYVSVGEWDYPAILPDGRIGEFGFNGLLMNTASASTRGVPFPQGAFFAGKTPVKDYVKDYMVPSVKELLDKTKPDLIWYDGEWNNSSKFWHTGDLDAYYYNRALRDKQEVCINDRWGGDIRGRSSPKIHADFGVIKRNVGGTTAQCDYWEECNTFSNNFGYDWREQSGPNFFTSDKGCINFFVDVVGRGGNLLLMMSPTGTGEIPPRQLHVLHNLGDWLKKYGQAIYGTRAYPLEKQPDWGRITHSKDGSTVYLLVTHWPTDGRINVPSVPIQGIATPR